MLSQDRAPPPFVRLRGQIVPTSESRDRLSTRIAKPAAVHNPYTVHMRKLGRSCTQFEDPASTSTRRQSFRIVAVGVLALTMLGLSGTTAQETTSSTPRPILVELFTSQGCSSCPAADRLLSELAATDENIVALAFHVDYWNYIGWTDPFSSSDWSDRQRRYAQALEARQIYTPQLVVNGRRHAVGSDRQEVAAMIRSAAKDNTGGDSPAGTLDLEITHFDSKSLSVRLRTELESHTVGANLVAWIAVVENGLETPVGKGENARRTLRNDRVIRRLERVDRVATGSQIHTTEIQIDLDPAWRRDRLSIAAFLQDPKSLHVLASQTLPLEKSQPG